ncbi:MAG: ComEA family DNA-binding protein [Candidatus Shapirobacteria bacterium]|nr:ComEA family DNA-binding protein [Candidatus Shapirobacteria bacterium]
MFREKLGKFKWVDGLLVLGIILVIAGIGMNFQNSFWERAEVKLVKKEISITPINDVQVDSKVTIDVGGEVINPGIYTLDKEARVNEALVVAGGLSAKADRDWVEKNLNKAEKLVDGQKLYIPKVGENVLGSNTTEIKIVRINSATVEQLDTLNGIGPAMAERIVDYRTKNGGFKNVEELKLVSGIGDKLFEKIKDEVGL